MQIAAPAAAYFAAASLIAAAAPAPRQHLAHPEALVEIRSYGEQYRDLKALLVPFLAKHRFYESSLRDKTKAGAPASAFTGPDGDFAATTGRYNCVLVAYYSTRTEPSSDGAMPRDRANSFTIALDEFLTGLPEPRPTFRVTTWGATHCANPT